MIPYKSATKIVICKNKTNIHTAASATAAQAARLWERWPLFLGEVVNGNRECSIFGKIECSVFRNSSTSFSVTMMQHFL